MPGSNEDLNKPKKAEGKSLQNKLKEFEAIGDMDDIEIREVEECEHKLIEVMSEVKHAGDWGFVLYEKGELKDGCLGTPSPHKCAYW